MKRKPTILVVDDDKDVLELFQMVLKEKYTVPTAKKGKEALELVEKKKPDLVILDLKLPDMNGIEILRGIKRISEDIEVIMITGYGTIKTARIAMRLGAYDYITKPFHIGYVEALIEDALSSSVRGPRRKARSDEEILKGASAVEKLAKIGHCKQKKACLWEIAVKGFLLGQDRVSIEWMEDPEIPKKEKLELMELGQIIKSNAAKKAENGSRRL